MENWRTTKVKKLAQAFLFLRKERDVMNFLRDLCTLEELEALSDRWEAVVLLAAGESYRKISAKTGLSTTTVTRIAHWLEHGEGGYRKVLENMQKQRK